MNLYDFYQFDGGNIIIVNEENSGSGTGFFSFGTNSNTLVTFDQTNASCLPGGSVTFVAAASGTTFNGTSPDIYKQATVSGWGTNLVHVSSTQEKYVFNVPASATPMVYDFI